MLMGGGGCWLIYLGWWWMVVGAGKYILADGGSWWWVVVGSGIVQSNSKLIYLYLVFFNCK